MKWVKGQSGNPGGRPKRTEELSLAISEFDEDYRKRLHDIATKGADKDSVAAIKLLWAYAHGNPTQPISGPNGVPLVPDGAAEVTLEIARRLAESMAKKDG